MNDIERQIEGIEDNDKDIEIKEEEDTIKHQINRNRDDDKKKRAIMYVVIVILTIVLVGLLIFILLDNKNIDNNNINDNDEAVNGDIEKEDDNVDNDNLGYVSCDDNTALLNVRNSTSGDIIDGLSCYKEVTIIEELEGTEVCDKWYKIDYNKNDRNYTGYACGLYIKKLEVSKSVVNDVRNIIDKANNYYEESVLKAYCGNTSGTKIIEFDDNMTGEYVKSEYSNIEELKNYVRSFLDDGLIKTKFELSDVNNPKYYDNYYEIDGSLYCRNYSGKGWITFYTGNYDIEVVSVSDNKINANISYEYINENSNCSLNEILGCNRNDFVYEIGNITIQNGIITKIDFHK